LDGSLSAIGNFDANVQKPVTTTVPGEVGAVLDGCAGRNRPALEDPKLAAVEVKPIRSFFEITPLQWNPSKMLLASIAQVRSTQLESGLGVLLTDSIDGSAVDAQFLARPGSEFVQIEPAEPLAAKAQRIFLSIVAVVKDKVHRTGLLVQQAMQRFKAVPLYQQSTVYINSTKEMQQSLQRFALALYLPAMNDPVSREF
jgi:hypothetical protein